MLLAHESFFAQVENLNTGVAGPETSIILQLLWYLVVHEDHRGTVSTRQCDKWRWSDQDFSTSLPDLCARDKHDYTLLEAVIAVHCTKNCEKIIEFLNAPMLHTRTTIILVLQVLLNYMILQN